MVFHAPFGGAASSSWLPYSIDFTALGDGVLPDVWSAIPGTFAISSGVLVNTPSVGANLFEDPGLEYTYTDGLCGYLVESGTAIFTESADVHGGSKAQQMAISALNDEMHYWDPVAGTAGGWYRFSAWLKRAAGTTETARTSIYQVGMKPSETNYTPINADPYTKYQVVGISTTINRIFAYPAIESGSANFCTVIADDGTLELLTYSTLFAMLPSVSRLATVKIQPSTIVDGTLTGAVAWANASVSPTTYLLATIRIYLTGWFRAGLTKCVSGTYTQLINESGDVATEDAWLEIRPTDDTHVGLYYNDAQIGSDVEVTDVTGNKPGIVISGGNNLKGFFVG